MRGGRSAVLDEPVVLEYPGQCHITLAPQLKSTQPFVEYIAHFFSEAATCGDCATQYFEVHDPGLPMQEKLYLLAICLRGGVLYFQAIMRGSGMIDHQTNRDRVREFSEAVMTLHPLVGKSARQSEERIQAAVIQAAERFSITLIDLHQT